MSDMGLETVVEQRYFPIFGRGWARLMGHTPAQIALSRLTVTESMLSTPFELEVLDSKHYKLSLDGAEILKGTIGQQANGNGVSLLVSDLVAAPGTKFKVVKQPMLVAINGLLDSFSVADKGKDTGVLQLSLTGEDPVTVRKTLDSIARNYLLQNVERKSEEAAKSPTS